MRTTIAVFVFLLPVTCGLTTTPSNTAGANTFTLQCGTDTGGDLYWNTLGGTPISVGSLVFSNFTSIFKIVTPASGEYNLECKASNCSEQAGAYQCSDSQNVAVAEAVVLTSTPVCSVSPGYLLQSQDTVQIDCYVGYFGAWGPVMTWSVPGGVTYSITNVTQANYVSSQLVMTASSFLNSKAVQMITYFDQPTPGSITQTGYAKNVIPYTNTWQSSAFYLTAAPPLSVGAIIGISLAVVVVLVVIILLLIFLVCLPKYKASKADKTKAPPGPGVTAEMFDTLSRNHEDIVYQIPTSVPINMDLTTGLPQADRGEEYISYHKPAVGKLNMSGNMAASQNRLYFSSPESSFSNYPENGGFTVNPEPMFQPTSSRSSSGPIPTYPYIESPAPEKPRRRQADYGTQQIAESPRYTTSLNGSVPNVFTFPTPTTTGPPDYRDTLV